MTFLFQSERTGCLPLLTALSGRESSSDFLIQGDATVHISRRFVGLRTQRTQRGC